ncbi:unnamed protein product, partial [Scytosiphon promiscuus]
PLVFSDLRFSLFVSSLSFEGVVGRTSVWSLATSRSCADFVEYLLCRRTDRTAMPLGSSLSDGELYPRRSCRHLLGCAMLYPEFSKTLQPCPRDLLPTNADSSALLLWCVA